MKKDHKKRGKNIKKITIKRFAMKPSSQVKDQIIYVRLRLVDVEKLDLMRKEFEISSRSEMIRSLVVGAMEKVVFKS
jgi:hypothetical protein